ncbi:MAG TPA: HAD family hydrolase [Gemmatimonadota bacterium]|nr:HAD family hydrolase [Gemmatimonadota bacterium]
MSGTTAAFFDVDGTLVDSDIVRYGVEIRTAEMSAPRRALWIAGFLPRIPYYLVLDRKSRAAFQRAFYRVYRGLDPDDLEERSRALFHHYVEPRLFPAGLGRLTDHRRRGHRVVLVSGSVEAIVRPLAERLEVRDVLAPRLEAADGRLTGRLDRPPLAGERKADAVREFAQANDIDLEASFAYADSLDDLPMLEAVGRPAAVNPEGRLFDTALERGWDVYRWKDLEPFVQAAV